MPFHFGTDTKAQLAAKDFRPSFCLTQEEV
jgi:hypothetical protein